MIQSDRIDLTNCDREPIHIPGSIQPHGAMLVCESENATVAFASANLSEVLGIRCADALGRPLIDVLGEDNAHELRNALTTSGTSAAGAVLLAVRLANSSAAFDIIAHRHQDRLIIEFEPAQAHSGVEDSLSITQTLIRRISLETEVTAIATSAARLVRATLGYDRVMVYRFLHNGAGCVIAESRRPDMHSFLNQHFPAADIPQQARRLYLQNWLRVIADASYAPAPLLAAARARTQPVDMSHAHLRSVSPIHCEYLRNMGVKASLSISIVIDGELWGLITCHHDSPRTIPLSLRAAAEMFGQYCSLQITVAERRAELHAASEARQRLDRLARSFAPDESIEAALRQRLRDLAELIPCDGAALWLDGEWTAVGSVPRPEQVHPVIRALAQQDFGAVWDTHELGSHTALELDEQAPVAGMLAVPISARARDYLLLFRDEEAQSVTWAGPPEKTVTAGPHGLRLTPRGSFDAWREDVRGRAPPWTDAERAVADVIKTCLRDIVLRHSELVQAERARTEQRRRILNDELNHRVKNILALVKSIATQTGAHAASIEDYTAALEGRLRALSYAHDQTLAYDSGADLLALVETEASLYRYRIDDGRVQVCGPRVGFTETGFSALALVIHEMMTNAAKYGALATAKGSLSIEWSLNRAGDCELQWIESTGQAMVEPTRKGFGSTLIDSAMTYDLGGSVTREFTAGGLRASFVIPARHVVLGGAAMAPLPVVVPASRPLAGLDVLLVEDRALIALDTENVLYKLGAVAVAAYPNVATALRAVTARPPDIAVLDFNLGEETSAVLADLLMSRDIPFVFLTGYADTATIPPRFGDIPIIRKPLGIDSASQAFVMLLQGAARHSPQAQDHPRT